MIFENLLVKIDDDSIRLVNISNEIEAAIEKDYLAILRSISNKTSQEDLNENELNFLYELEELMEIVPNSGIGELTIRTGKLDNLEIELTNNCMLKCKHCYQREEDKIKKEEHIDFSCLKKTISEAENIGLYKIKLCGGEPLLYNHIEELLIFLSTQKLGVTIITNGLLLDRFIDLLDPKQVSLVISLDGFQHSHDYLRGEGCYNKTLDNIKLSIRKKIDVSINMVVYDENLNDIDDFNRYLEALGVSRLNIQVVRFQGMAAKYLTDKFTYNYEFLRSIHKNELEQQLELIENGGKYCNLYATGLSINCDGVVTGCPFLDNSKVGSILSDSIVDIFERSNCEYLLQEIYENAECNKCSLFGKSCAGGCRARAQRVVGSVTSCDYWIPFLLNHPKFNESPNKPCDYLLI